jgi:hypothetical protein
MSISPSTDPPEPTDQHECACGAWIKLDRERCVECEQEQEWFEEQANLEPLPTLGTVSMTAHYVELPPMEWDE